MNYTDSETLYISQMLDPNWDDFKKEASKRHLTLSKYMWTCGKNQIRKTNVGEFFTGITFVFVSIILMKVIFL